MLKESGGISIVDISNPTSPVLVASPATTANGTGGIAVSGRYIYTDTYDGSTFKVFDMGGIETNGLYADSARFGNLSVLGDTDIGGSLTLEVLYRSALRVLILWARFYL